LYGFVRTKKKRGIFFEINDNRSKTTRGDIIAVFTNASSGCDAFGKPTMVRTHREAFSPVTGAARTYGYEIKFSGAIADSIVSSRRFYYIHSR
jgi:hypothetical protein